MPLIMPRDEFELLRRLSIQLTDAVAAIAASEGAEVSALCLKRPEVVRPGVDMVCDRKKDHPGKHTWELAEIIGQMTIVGPPQAKEWTVPPGKIRELIQWMQAPSGTYYPSDLSDPSLIFEAAMHGAVRIRARL